MTPEPVGHSNSAVVCELDVMTDKKDKLNHVFYAKHLTAIMGDPKTKTPLTVGLFANWGRGKSSMIELIEEQVVGHNKQGI